MYSQKLDTSISFGDFLAMFDDADSGLQGRFLSFLRCLADPLERHLRGMADGSSAIAPLGV